MKDIKGFNFFENFRESFSSDGIYKSLSLFNSRKCFTLLFLTWVKNCIAISICWDLFTQAIHVTTVRRCTGHFGVLAYKNTFHNVQARVLTFIPHVHDCPHHIISVWPLLVVLHFCSDHIFQSCCASTYLSSSPVHILGISLLQSLDTFVHIFQDMSLWWITKKNTLYTLTSMSRFSIVLPFSIIIPYFLCYWPLSEGEFDFLDLNVWFCILKPNSPNYM